MHAQSSSSELRRWRVKEDGVKDCVLAACLINAKPYGSGAVVDQVFAFSEFSNDFYRGEAIQGDSVKELDSLAAILMVPVQKVESYLVAFGGRGLDVHGHGLLACDGIAGVELAETAGAAVGAVEGRCARVVGG